MVKPGDQVTCSLHPDWGVGTLSATCKGNGFIYWGEFGKMQDRKYEYCDLSLIKLFL